MDKKVNDTEFDAPQIKEMNGILRIWISISEKINFIASLAKIPELSMCD